MINPEVGDLFYIDGLKCDRSAGNFSQWLVEADGNKERLFMILEDGYSWDFEREMRVHLTTTCYWCKRIE